MTDTSWKRITDDRFETLVANINALHHADFFDTESTRLQEQPVSFYKDYKLLEATEFASHPPLTMRFFAQGDDVKKLDGTRQAIYEVNKAAEIILNDNTIVDYVKFFLGALMTEEGSFRVVEKIEDVTFSDEPDDKTVKDIEGNICKAEVLKRDDTYFVEVNMLFGDGLHEATVSVAPDGELDIIDEDTLMSGLPTRQIFLK